MSSPIELVYLAEDSPLVSLRKQALKFIAAPFMGKRPQPMKGAGASFGSFQLRDGTKTGWLFIPNPAALDTAARKAYSQELRAAHPGLDQTASERMELEKLCWEYAETRRLSDMNREVVRLANLPEQTPPPQVQPPVAMQPGDVYHGEWCAPALRAHIAPPIPPPGSDSHL